MSNATNLNAVQTALTEHYRQLAKPYFQDRIDYWMQHSALSDLDAPKLVIRKMRKRWGSYSLRGNINLNLWLIRYPPQLIDLVIVHELCHMREFNHSPAFYALMGQVLPNWNALEQQLHHHPDIHIAGLDA